jgi:truncated hemoglobin YjbI
VNKFYEIMLQDERVKDYFSETSMEKQIKSQK